MTEEEINKKAEKHCNEVLCNAHEKCYEVIKCRDWRSRRAGFFCGYEQALKDLEKEKAELKKANETLGTMNNNMWVELEKKRAESQGITNKLHQLIEAKELLKQWLQISKTSGCDNINIVTDTEQFLNSKVEK